MRWEEFNDLVAEVYPWRNETYEYSIKFPALDISFDSGGQCRQCRKFTVDLLNQPSYKYNGTLFDLVYKKLLPRPRICSRQCLFDYINENSGELLEKLTQ